jgi:hypothetical protein
MDIEFKNLSELRERVTPALNTKLKELKAKNYNYVTIDDIWDFLIKNWKKSKNLTLYDIINAEKTAAWRIGYEACISDST